jgi:hypothetical protein
VQLLAKDDLVRLVVSALVPFGARAAGELVSVLLDPTTPDVLRRRVPLALKSCPSAIARDGLLTALESFGFEIRLRCGRALLTLRRASRTPEVVPLLWHSSSESSLRAASRTWSEEHVFNLLALTLEREPVRICGPCLHH